ncbi:DLD2, partial [Symbiodinium sp. KB8]
CADLWALRENVAPAASTHGLVLKYDVSLPAQRMHELVRATQDRLTGAVAAGQLAGASLATLGSATHGELVHLGPEDIVVMGYGHIGDGNLHLNELLEPWVFEWVLAAGGSVSAEHGVGQAKVQWVGRARSPEAVQAMQDVKRAFDPLGIMNPGKVLPQ